MRRVHVYSLALLSSMMLLSACGVFARGCPSPNPPRKVKGMTESQRTSATGTIALELVRCGVCQSQDVTVCPADEETRTPVMAICSACGAHYAGRTGWIGAEDS